MATRLSTLRHKGTVKYKSGSEAAVSSRLKETLDNWPDPVKRKKPDDLFANATGRWTRRTSWTGTIGQSVNSASDPSLIASVTASWDYWGAPSKGTFKSFETGAVFNRLDSKMRSRIKDQKVNVAMMIAEGRQTYQLFHELSADMARMVRSLKGRRATADLVRSLQNPRTTYDKRLANRWLQYQFGVRPLMSDLYESAQLLREQVVRGIYRYDEVTEKGVVPWRSHPVGDFNPSLFCEHYRAKLKCRYRVRDSQLLQLSSLGITNPLAVLWELTPWSFAIDWVINVGEFLDSLDALVGIDQLYCQRSYGYYLGINQGIAVVKPSPPEMLYHYSSRWREGTTSALSLPKLSFRNPITSVRRSITALSLLVQKVR